MGGWSWKVGGGRICLDQGGGGEYYSDLKELANLFFMPHLQTFLINAIKKLLFSWNIIEFE